MILKADALSPAQKSVIEQILGRQILEVEAISLHAFTLQVPTVAGRQAATEKLRQLLEDPARPRPIVSDEEYEAAFLEAMRTVRPDYTTVP